MKTLFVMDPIHRIQVSGDSTYVVMREHTRRGHPLAWCTPSDLYLRDGRLRAHATWGTVTATGPWFHPGGTEDVDAEVFDVIWMRKDPPFDMTYVFTTYLLDRAPAHVLVLNGPEGLRRYNEKIFAMGFPELHPSTLLTNDMARVRAFVASTEHGAVLKPWDGNGGRGVLIVSPGDRNLPSMVELMTNNGRDYVIAQAYLPGVRRGDKRILLFDGDPVGAILRVPGDADHRANMHVGASVAATELTARDREICAALAPRLRELDQLFVGIDVIGDMLTEVNVTSPTGLREVEALYGTALEVDLVDRVEAKLAQRRGAA